jgi:hypothetical protein
MNDSTRGVFFIVLAVFVVVIFVVIVRCILPRSIYRL